MIIMLVLACSSLLILFFDTNNNNNRYAKVGRRRRLSEEPPEDPNSIRKLLVSGSAGISFQHGDSISVNTGRTSERSRGRNQALMIEFGDADANDLFAVRVKADKHYGTPVFETVGGMSSCPGESATNKIDSAVEIKSIEYYCPSSMCTDLPYGSTATIGVTISNLSPSRFHFIDISNTVNYRIYTPISLVTNPNAACGADGNTKGLNMKFAGERMPPISEPGAMLTLPKYQSEIFIKLSLDTDLACLHEGNHKFEYNNIPIRIVSGVLRVLFRHVSVSHTA